MLSNAAIKIAAPRSGRPWVRPAAGGNRLPGGDYRTWAHGLVLERAAFLDVLHRLFVSGSDRSANRWRDDLCDCRRRGASALCCCGPRRHEGGAEIVISGMRAQH